MKKLILIACAILLSVTTFAENLKLWYDRPADYWVEALPLGNGHLGAMVYGIAARDTIQLNDGALHLLPALPDVWKDGEVKGLRARGGFEITSMQWKDGEIVSVTVKSTLGGNLRLRSASGLTLADGSPLTAASGVNPNPLMQTYPTLPPVIKDKSKIPALDLAPVHEYDLPTTPATTYTLLLAD